jgi:hypothetical protein
MGKGDKKKKKKKGEIERRRREEESRNRPPSILTDQSLSFSPTSFSLSLSLSLSLSVTPPLSLPCNQQRHTLSVTTSRPPVSTSKPRWISARGIKASPR